MKSPFSVLVCLLGLSVGSPALARDWFVRMGSDGNGTQQQPFGDPWQALAQCEAGDKIHVAEGKYYGRQESGLWEIPFARVQLLGGYDASFKSRDPWKHPTELIWKAGSKNRPGGQNRITGKNDDHSGCRIDGFVIDVKEQNTYVDGSLKPGIWQPTPVAIDHPGSVIANNIILNASWDAIVVKQGVTVENNLIVNAVNSAIQVRPGTTLKNDTNTQPAVVRNNTIAFTWTYKEPGSGGQPGSAIQVMGPAVIEGNIIMNADNHGIYVAGVQPKEISLKDNVFFMNLFSNIKLALSARGTIIDDKEMESLDEVGFKAASGNDVQNPKIALDKAWMDKFSQRSAAQPGQVEMDEWNKLRQTMGLTLIAKGGKAYEGLAPPWELDKALAFFDAKGTKAGAKRKALTVEPFSSAPSAAAPSRTYEKSNVLDWAQNPGPMNGKAVEITVAVGMPYGIAYTKVDGVSEATHTGVKLYDPSPKEAILALVKKGTAVARAIEAAKYIANTSNQPAALYTVRGVVVAIPNSVPKAGILVDSISEIEVSAATASGARPKGRDWFVKKGAKGGDGSREKPFKDPYFALDRAEAGDTIHVAEGDYNGKLKSAQYKIDMPFIALLGGYDEDFKERDPWKHPTLLRFIKDEKNDYGQGPVIEGLDDHRGTIIDGFVFDRRDYNKYQASGDILRDNSNKSEPVILYSPGSIVRNCVFLNGAGNALTMSTGTVVENNIFINFLYQQVNIRRGDDVTPALVRNNTFLFSWNDKFGVGTNTQGYALKFETGARGVADNNIFEFIDNHAIEVFGSPGDVAITNNVFSHNLYSNYETSPSGRFIDDATMSQFKEAGLKAAEGNVVMNAGLPIDPKWFEIYSNRTGTVPGKVTMDDWNQLRDIMGLPLIAKGGSGPSGFAPMYDYKKAVQLFPKNAKVKAGARHSTLPVKFEGVVREEPKYSYEAAEWSTLSRDWQSLEGKRVALKIAISGVDNQWNLPAAGKDDYTSVKFIGPDMSGLPKRLYVKKGTRHDRTARHATPLHSGEKPKEFYVLKGVVHKNGEIIADAVEPAE